MLEGTISSTISVFPEVKFDYAALAKSTKADNVVIAENMNVDPYACT